MKKWLVISDSFKGTLSSRQIGELAKETIQQYLPDTDVITIPVADGGEGTVDSFLEIMPGERVVLPVTGPDGQVVEAAYGLFEDFAVIEMAAGAGLTLPGTGRPDLLTTFGVGELIQDALNRGVKQVILGLGGSATNDGGCGCATALGAKFFNSSGEVFLPTGGNLEQITDIDLSEIDLQGAEFLVMCDIDNPLHGLMGAAHVFSPQKGADPAMVEHLDRGLKHLDQVIRERLNLQVADIPGAGAAGGMGAGMVAFLGGELRPGIDIILDRIDFEKQLDDVSVVLTGEGKLDSQSLGGKVVLGVSRRAKQKGVPVIALVGVIGDGIEEVYSQGVDAVFTTNHFGLSYEEIKQRDVAADYQNALADMLRLISLRLTE